MLCQQHLDFQALTYMYMDKTCRERERERGKPNSRQEGVSKHSPQNLNWNGIFKRKKTTSHKKKYETPWGSFWSNLKRATTHLAAVSSQCSTHPQGEDVTVKHLGQNVGKMSSHCLPTGPKRTFLISSRDSTEKILYIDLVSSLHVRNCMTSLAIIGCKCGLYLWCFFWTFHHFMSRVYYYYYT